MGAQAVRLSNVDIDNALKNKDFEVLFQPIFDLGNGALARVETFVRWRHPSLGVLPPGAFISFFESQGRMSELSRYVLSEAITQYIAWRGASAPGFSINLALSDLADEAFASHFEVLLRDRGFPADLITLECPMPPVTMELDTAASHFHRLAKTGARLAIEVRGRANDFLRAIDPFPFDEIKTGGSAILRFARTVRGPGLSAISELLDIATKANAAITAVGVEDQASLAALRGLGFAAAQGNHLGKVGPLSAFSPTRVNEVRALLDLEPLSSENLSALFRTEAPAPQQAAVAETAPAETYAPQAEDEDELVERLAARLARHTETSKPAQTAVRRKGDMAKAAAIARAKKKAAQNAAANASSESLLAAETNTEAGTHSISHLGSDAARRLQERLSREFDAPADQGGASEHMKTQTDTTASAIPEEGAQEMMTASTKTDMDGLDETAKAENKDDSTAGDDAALVAEPVEKAAETSAAQTAPELIQASLAVGQTHAYFRPGMYVGAIAEAAETSTQQTAPLQDIEPASETAPSAVEEVLKSETPETEAGEAASETSHEINEGDVDNDDETGDISWTEASPDDAEAEDLLDASEPDKAQPQKKNFLTRRYRLWPEHFWPRSWKRAWRRRQKAIEARRADTLLDEAPAPEETPA